MPYPSPLLDIVLPPSYRSLPLRTSVLFGPFSMGNWGDKWSPLPYVSVLHPLFSPRIGEFHPPKFRPRPGTLALSTSYPFFRIGIRLV